MYTRLYKYPKKQSFFLFGPRGSGKSTWLKKEFPQALYIDLLDEVIFQEYIRNPNSFKLELNSAQKDQWIIVDEIQRAPHLLNYVHQALSEQKYQFILTGSSARKLKKENANLLAGRAFQKHFNPLSARELGSDFNIQKSLKVGHLPQAYTSEFPNEYLKSYIGTYLQEEIQQEGLVRNLVAFSQFMEAMAFSQGQIISAQAIGADLGVDRKTVEAYIEILEDLLIGHRIQVFQKKAKRKMTVRPKFYYFDVGVYRTLRKKGPLDLEEEFQGAALETLVFQELKNFIDSENKELEIFFYRTQSKQEVDFILYGQDGFFGIEVKRSARFREEDLKSLKLFKHDYPEAKAILLYGGDKNLRTNDGIEIIPLQNFLVEIDKKLLFP